MPVTGSGLGRALPATAGPPAGLRAQRVVNRCLQIVLLIWFATVFLHQTNFGGSWDPVAWQTWALLGAWLLCFTLAFWVVALLYRNRPDLKPTAVDQSLLNWTISALAIVGAVGATLIIYDFAVLRGYGFASSVVAIRVEEATDALRGISQSSAVSGVGRLTIPAIMPAYLLAVYRWNQVSVVTRVILAVSSLITLGEQMLFEGGRFFITAIAVTIVICYFVRPAAEGVRAPKRKIPYIRLGILAAILLSFFAYVFVDRILERGDFFWSAYLSFAGAYAIDVDYGTIGRFEGPLGPIWFSASMLWLYITQGISELDLLLSIPYFEHANGFYQLPQVAQIAEVLFGLDWRYDIVANLPKIGTYPTFYGSNFIDFGNIGAVLSGAVLGGASSRALFGFALGRLDPISLLAPILFTICLFTSVVSLITMLWPAIFWVVGAGLVLNRPSRS